MIKAFAQSQKWQDALLSLDWPFSSNDVAKKTTVLSACGRVSQWALLCLLADPKRQSEVVLSNVAINSLRWQDTCDILASFALSALKPDKISFQSTLSSCSRGRQWTIALDLHDSKTAVQSCAAYNVVVRSCGQEGKWRSAVAILQGFQLRRLSEQSHRKDFFGKDEDKRAASLVTSTISGCEKSAWQLVLSCLRHGCVRSVRSDAVMLTAATKNCTMARLSNDFDQHEDSQRSSQTNLHLLLSQARTTHTTLLKVTTHCGSKQCSTWHVQFHLESR